MVGQMDMHISGFLGSRFNLVIMSQETVHQGSHSCTTLVAGLRMADHGENHGEKPPEDIEAMIQALRLSDAVWCMPSVHDCFSLILKPLENP